MVGKRGKRKSGGKDSKKQAICRTYVYVKNHSEKLADIISSLCIEGAMSLKKGMMGVAFVFPSKDMLKEIIDDFENGREEVARDKIFSLILPDRFIAPEDFKKKAVGSRNGALYQVKEVSGDKVMFSSPSGDWSIKRADDYRELEGSYVSGKISIWTLVSGVPPVKTEEVYVIPYEPRKMGMQGGAPEEEEQLAEAQRKGKELKDAKMSISKLNVELAGKSANDALPILAGAFARLFDGPEDPSFVDIFPLVDADPVVNYVLFMMANDKQLFHVKSSVGSVGVVDSIVPLSNFVRTHERPETRYDQLVNAGIAKMSEFIKSAKGGIGYPELRKNFDVKVNYQQFQDNVPTIAELRSYVIQLYKEALSSGGVSDGSTISYPPGTVAALQKLVPDVNKLADHLLNVDLIRFMIHSRLFTPKYDDEGGVCEFAFAVDQRITLAEMLNEVNNGDLFQFVFGSNVDKDDQWNLSTMFISSTDFVYVLSNGLGSTVNFSGDKYSGKVIIASDSSELIDFQTPVIGYVMNNV